MPPARRPRGGRTSQQSAARSPRTPPTRPQSASAAPTAGARVRRPLRAPAARPQPSTAGRIGARRRRCDSAGACDGAANDAGKSWATRARGTGSMAAAAVASNRSKGPHTVAARMHEHTLSRIFAPLEATTASCGGSAVTTTAATRMPRPSTRSVNFFVAQISASSAVSSAARCSRTSAELEDVISSPAPCFRGASF